jgi:PadR family transcriptional regulator PadR
MGAELELAVLLSVLRLGDRAYGLSVRDEVSARLSHDYSIGAIYTTLDRLTAKKLLSAKTVEGTAERGRRFRRQFRLTASGHRAVVAAQNRSAAMWSPTPTNPVTEGA